MKPHLLGIAPAVFQLLVFGMGADAAMIYWHAEHRVAVYDGFNEDESSFIDSTPISTPPDQHAALGTTSAAAQYDFQSSATRATLQVDSQSAVVRLVDDQSYSRAFGGFGLRSDVDVLISVSGWLTAAVASEFSEAYTSVEVRDLEGSHSYLETHTYVNTPGVQTKSFAASSLLAAGHDYAVDYSAGIQTYLHGPTGNTETADAHLVIHITEVPEPPLATALAGLLLLCPTKKLLAAQRRFRRSCGSVQRGGNSTQIALLGRCNVSAAGVLRQAAR